MDDRELASDDVVARVAAALEKRNVQVIVVSSSKEALDKLIELVPEGAEMHTGTSTTLQDIGYIDFLMSDTGRYNILGKAMAEESDPERRLELRRRAATAQYFISSVHAIAETGEVVVASRTGSQIAPYAFGSQHVIWVVGTQKIVPTLEDAIRRVREYSLPMEDQRVKKLGGPGSIVGKFMIFENEIQPDRITAVLVKEKVGY